MVNTVSDAAIVPLKSEKEKNNCFIILKLIIVLDANELPFACVNRYLWHVIDVIDEKGEVPSETVVHPDGVTRPRPTAAFKRAQMDAWRKVNADVNAKAKSAGFKNAWTPKMSLIVERWPLLAPEPEAWEVEYDEWRARYDAPIKAQIPSMQPLLDEDPAKKQIAAGETKKLTAEELAAMDEDQRARALRAEEIADQAREEAIVRVGERITTADKENNTKSLRRALADKLYLVVKKNRADHSWQFPQAPLPTELTGESKMLRDFAHDGIVTAAGSSINVHVTGNAPAGFYAFPYNAETQKSLDTYGSKIFFYRALYIKGDVKTHKRYVDHAWVTKSELKNYISDPELYKYLDGILF